MQLKAVIDGKCAFANETPLNSETREVLVKECWHLMNPNASHLSFGYGCFFTHRTIKIVIS